MDASHFDRLTLALAGRLSRRRVGPLLAALGLGSGLGAAPAVAKSKKKKKKKCKNGTVRCGKACIDTRSDPAHCGGCNRPCGGQGCVNGSCQGGGGGCSGGQISCGGECVDTRTNRNHCGTCNNACGAGETCTNGTCLMGCVGSCSGKLCGDDGCGGSCGTCSQGEQCSDAFVCEQICTPSCYLKECGWDGCSGECGQCTATQKCCGFVCVDKACPCGYNCSVEGATCCGEGIAVQPGNKRTVCRQDPSNPGPLYCLGPLDGVVDF